MAETYILAAMEALHFNTRDELTRIELCHVAYFEANSNYTNVYYTNGSRLSLSRGISIVAATIRSANFVRLGRSHIINIAYVQHINVPKRELLLADLTAGHTFKLQLPKTVLRELKDMLEKETGTPQ